LMRFEIGSGVNANNLTIGCFSNGVQKCTRGFRDSRTRYQMFPNNKRINAQVPSVRAIRANQSEIRGKVQSSAMVVDGQSPLKLHARSRQRCSDY